MKELSGKLQNLLEQAVLDGEVAGGSVLVIRGGEEKAWAQAGFADVEKKKPFARNTIARLYSMTKPVTAAAAMILVQRGQLDLGMPVGDIIPAFRDMQVWEDGKKVPARRSLLVKDLLSMTSGLSYPGMDESGQEAARIFEEVDERLYGDKPLTTMEIAQMIGESGLAFHPGDKWMYGTSADVLGAVIESVSGMTFGQFLKEELFDPLGMADTGFFVPEEKQHRLAEVYEKTEMGVQRCVTNNLGICYTQHRAPAFESGGAGLVSTIDDYAKFAAMLLGHGKQILKPATIQYMTKAKLTPWQQDSLWRSWESMYGYGYGSLMRILEEPGMAMLNGWKGEYGWDGWLGTYFCNSPANDTTVLMFFQRKDAGTMNITRKIRNVIAAQLEGGAV